MMPSRRTFLTILSGAIVSGCGFKLRGTDASIGQLPAQLSIEAVDPYARMIKSITRQLIDQGCDVIKSDDLPKLSISTIQSSERILGPVSNGDQIEMVLEMSYKLTGIDQESIVPQTVLQSTLVYVDSGLNSPAEDSRIAQLKQSLEDELLQQVVPSIRIRYHQALKDKKRNDS